MKINFFGLDGYKMKFKKMVVPGDVLKLEVKIITFTI